MTGQSGGVLVVALGEVLWDLLPGGRELGGAPANCGRHARRLGVTAALVSAVGDDEPGGAIRAALEAEGLDLAGLAVDPHHPTGTVEVTVGPGGEPEFRIVAGVAWDHIPASPAVIELAARADALCYGTLGSRGEASRATVRQCLDACRADCVRVLDVNLRGPDVDVDLLGRLLERSTVVKLNEAELASLAACLPLDGGGDVVDRLVEIYRLPVVAVTRGARGAVLYARGHRYEHSGFSVAPVDTVGAGDAFTAALIVGLLRGDDPERILEDANRLASLTCQHAGACPPPRGNP